MDDVLQPSAEPLHASSRFDCVLGAWQRHESELLGFLTHQLADRANAEDLMQEVFLRALRQGDGFCAIEQPRAWLFQVARRAVIDHARATKAWVDVPDTLTVPGDESHAPLTDLTACLDRNLQALQNDDRDILVACDLQGQTVKSFADAHAMTLPAAKSRLLRARQRLRASLIERCNVRFDDTGRVCCHTPPRAG